MLNWRITSISVFHLKFNKSFARKSKSYPFRRISKRKQDPKRTSLIRTLSFSKWHHPEVSSRVGSCIIERQNECKWTMIFCALISTVKRRLVSKTNTNYAHSVIAYRITETWRTMASLPWLRRSHLILRLKLPRSFERMGYEWISFSRSIGSFPPSRSLAIDCSCFFLLSIE